MTPFVLVDARSAQQAAALLRAHRDAHAQPIACGGDLLGVLKEGIEGPSMPAPAVLVNLATAQDLRGIDAAATHVRLGAMTTLADLRRAPSLPPIVGEAIDRIASPQLRARTTLGGNLLQRPRCWYFRHPDVTCFKKGGRGCPALAGPADAYPGALFAGEPGAACHAGHPSDLAPVLIALDATIEVVGPDGVRALPVARLHDGAGRNPRAEAALAADEVIAAVVIPRRRSRQAFEKVAPRPANEFAWAGVAVVLEIAGARIETARIAASGIAPGPFVFTRAHELLAGRRAAAVDAAAVARALANWDDAVARSAPRAAMAQAAVERALARALVAPDVRA